MELLLLVHLRPLHQALLEKPTAGNVGDAGKDSLRAPNSKVLLQVTPFSARVSNIKEGKKEAGDP